MPAFDYDKLLWGERQIRSDEDLWRLTQAKLEANGVDRANTRDRAKQAYLLAGVVFDADGGPMTSTHAVKKGVRYRYYVSRRLITDVKAKGRRAEGQRLPAHELERLIIDRLRSFFADPDAVTASLRPRCRRASQIQRALIEAGQIVKVIDAESEGKIFDLLRPFVARAQVHQNCIDVELAAEQVSEALLHGRSRSRGDIRTMGKMVSTSTRRPATTIVRFDSPSTLGCNAREKRCVSSLTATTQGPGPMLLLIVFQSSFVMRSLVASLRTLAPALRKPARGKGWAPHMPLD